MKNQVFAFIAAITLISGAAARAEGVGPGAQITACVGGAAAAYVVTGHLLPATLSPAGRTVAMSASCVAGVSAARSVSSAEAAQAPEETDLRRSEPEQEE